MSKKIDKSFLIGFKKVDFIEVENTYTGMDRTYKESKFVPIVTSDDGNRIKNLMTGEVAPKSLLSVETKKEEVPANEFGIILDYADTIKLLSRNELLSLVERATDWEMYTSKIAQFIVESEKYIVDDNYPFAVKDYERFAKVLDGISKRIEKERMQEEAMRSREEKRSDDFFNF